MRNQHAGSPPVVNLSTHRPIFVALTLISIPRAATAAMLRRTAVASPNSTAPQYRAAPRPSGVRASQLFRYARRRFRI
eukprot:1495063-Pleurochrysis_carterae.AAC.7